MNTIITTAAPHRHRFDNSDSVSGWVGFNLGFRSTLPGPAGWFCTVDLNLYGYIWGTVISQLFGISDIEFKVAMQDAIKSPTHRPTQPETLWR